MKTEIAQMVRSIQQEAAIQSAWQAANGLAEDALGWPLIAQYHYVVAMNYADIANGIMDEARAMPWRLAREVRRRMMYGYDRSQWLGGK